MKKKIDYVFILFITIVIAGGVYIHILRMKNKELMHFNHRMYSSMNTQSKQTNDCEQNILELCAPRSVNYTNYQTSSNQQIDQDDLKNKLIIYNPQCEADTMIGFRIEKIKENLDLFDANQVLVLQGNVPHQKDALGEDAYRIGTPLNVDSMLYDLGSNAALFYLDKELKQHGYMQINVCTKPLFNKYVRIIDQKYFQTESNSAL